MSELFADYFPTEWFDNSGLRKSVKQLGLSSTAAKRMRRWRNSVTKGSISVAISAAIGLATLTYGESAVAYSNEFDVPLPPGVVQVAPPPRADASLGEINKSFTDLFAAMRSGTKVISSPRSMELATKAAEKKDHRPDGWAHRIASDTKDAND